MPSKISRAHRVFTCALFCFLCTCLSVTTSARADLILITGNVSESTEGLGAFSGSIDYTYSGAGNTGTLVITITNETTDPNPGIITAFLFNVGGGHASSTATLIASSNSHFLNAAGSSGEPFGNPYDAGAGLGGTFLGGGSPVNGIHAGGTAVFTFLVSALDASSLTAMDFLDGGNYDHNFIVRFRGFANGDSDKVPGTIVPAPSTLALALLALVGYRRRRA